jgi:hypothetical protein
MLKKVSIVAAMFIGALAVVNWRPSLNPFAWIFQGQGNPATTSMPPKVDLQKLAELVTLKVNTERIVYGEDNFYKGIYFVPGNAHLGIDLKQAKITSDASNKKMKISLPEPHAVVARVDLKNVKQYDLSAKSWINFDRWFRGDKSKTAEGILKQAQEIIEKSCTDDEYIKASKTQAEFILKTLYTELGWEVEIEWIQTK